MPDAIRTFVAVLISDSLKRRISLVQEEFKKVAPKVKWVANENYHITIKFLGGVRCDRIEAVLQAVGSAVEGIEPFDIEIGEAGAFPNPGRPKTVWVGVTSGCEMLAGIAGRVDEALEKLGFEKETRPFRSHITIGRVKDDCDAKELGPALKNAEIGQLGSFKVESVAVMKSDLRREGPVYSVVREIVFQTPEGSSH
ncbi:MAG: RNA 2',3'-cyclic phosphodiesterase [Armatimonadota bacterium]